MKEMMGDVAIGGGDGGEIELAMTNEADANGDKGHNPSWHKKG